MEGTCTWIAGWPSTPITLCVILTAHSSRYLKKASAILTGPCRQSKSTVWRGQSPRFASLSGITPHHVLSLRWADPTAVLILARPRFNRIGFDSVKQRGNFSVLQSRSSR